MLVTLNWVLLNLVLIYSTLIRLFIKATKHNGKKDTPKNQEKSKSRKRSWAAGDKRRTLVDHLKRKEAIKKFQKHNYADLSSDSSYWKNSKPNSFSSSPKLKRTRFKRLTLDSSIKWDSVEKNKTFNKDDFFKTEFKKTQSELLEVKNKLYKLQHSYDLKSSEVEEARNEASALKKKMKSYKYYKDKARLYKEKLKHASLEMQKLEIENNSKWYLLI